MPASETVGFFTRQDVLEPIKRGNRSGLSQETIDRLGPQAVANMNPMARTKNMEPSGPMTPSVYILDQYPSYADDKDGRYLSGEPGALLKSALPVGWRDKTRINSIVHTYPGNRAPTPVEIDAFRKKVEIDIANTKPKVIIGLGQLVLNWILGRVSRDKNATIASCTGRYFPVEIAGHKCWFVPVNHPYYINTLIFGKVRDPSRPHKVDWDNTKYLKCADRLGRMLAPAWKKQLDAAFKRSRSSITPKIISEKKFVRGVEIIRSNAEGYARLRTLVGRTLGLRKFCVDLETAAPLEHDCKVSRPYTKNAKIVTVAITDRKGTYSFCYEHPMEPWSDDLFPKVRRLLRKLHEADAIKIAHNLPFDLEWLGYRFGQKGMAAGQWHCTLAQAYILDERVGGMSLQFLSVLNFGLRIKNLTEVDHARLDEEDPQIVCLYNGLDTKGTFKLYHRQRKLIIKEGLQEAYRLQRERVPALVNAQLTGFPVVQDRVKTHRTELAERMDQTMAKIVEFKSVRKYKKRYGSFNPDAPNQVKLLFEKIENRELVKDRDGKTSADEEQLKLIGTPLAHTILEFKKLSKLDSTYLKPLDTRNPEHVIWDDGRVHTTFNITKVVSGRISSENPNTCNLPKRTVEGKRVRLPYCPPPGWVVVACDQGQVEYRVIGAMSGDKVIRQSLFEGFDVHMECAKRIAKAYPRILDKPEYLKYSDEKARWKAFRTDVKTQWVFSAFYGAVLKSREGYLEVPEGSMKEVDDWFWGKMFGGVKKWQDELIAGYNANGYVTFMSGRRRHGPISAHQLINTPVQGSANDIVMDAMSKLFLKSVELNKPALAPILNIYDDLTTIVPASDQGWYVNEIVNTMLACDFDWINVPLLVEASVGPDLYSVKEVMSKTSNHGRKAA